MGHNKFFIQSLGMGLVISSTSPALAQEAQGQAVEHAQLAQLSEPVDSSATRRPASPRFESTSAEPRRDRLNDLTPEQRQAILERRRQREERLQRDGSSGGNASVREGDARPQGQGDGQPRFRQDMERARGEVYGRPPRR